jgi:hypothetical protein
LAGNRVVLEEKKGRRKEKARREKRKREMEKIEMIKKESIEGSDQAKTITRWKAY